MAMHGFDVLDLLKICGCEATCKKVDAKIAQFLRFRQTPRNRAREDISLGSEKIRFFCEN